MSKYDEPALAAIAATWAARLAVLGLAQDMAEAMARTIATEIRTAHVEGETAGMAFASGELSRAMGGGA